MSISRQHLVAILLVPLGCSAPVQRAPTPAPAAPREDHTAVLLELRRLQAQVTRLEGQIANIEPQADLGALEKSIESLERSVASLRTELARQSEVLARISETLSTPRPPPTAEPPEKEDVTVYVTRTGKKYHRTGCQYLRQSQIPMPLSEARARYGACSVCSPPVR